MGRALGAPTEPEVRPSAVIAGGRARRRGSTCDVGHVTGLGIAASSDLRRRLQIVLGCIWLADGLLQLQPFMFSRGFVSEILAPNAVGQPAVVSAPVRFAIHLIEPRVALFNGCAAAIQILIGLGLLHRRTVKAALLTSFVWALGVWWVGEGLGGLLSGTASPLTGAPGPALLYILAGLVLWPTRPPQNELNGRRVSWLWAVLWLGSAGLWLLPANTAADSVQRALARAPSGAAWLSSVQSTVATAAAGHGLEIAVAAACLSAAIGVPALLNRWAVAQLAVAIGVALTYLVLGQGLGGVLTGSGTDPGSGPLWVLMAVAVHMGRKKSFVRGS